MTKQLSELDLYIFCPHCGNSLVLKTIDNEKVKTCGKCNFIFWNKPKPVVSILLHKNNKILMLKRAKEPFKDYWVLPGGFIGYTETAEEAVKREAKEEIGSDVTVDGIIGVYRIDDDPRGIHIDIIFHGKVKEEIKVSKEDKNWKLFSPDKLPENIAYKHRDAINDWYAHHF